MRKRVHWPWTPEENLCGQRSRPEDPDGEVDCKNCLKQAAQMRTNPNRCQNCLHKIKVAIFKGTEWCSEDCRKALQPAN